MCETENQNEERMRLNNHPNIQHPKYPLDILHLKQFEPEELTDYNYKNILNSQQEATQELHYNPVCLFVKLTNAAVHCGYIQSRTGILA